MPKPKFETTAAYDRRHAELPSVPGIEAQRTQLLAKRKNRVHSYVTNRRRARMIVRLSSSYDPVKAAERLGRG